MTAHEFVNESCASLSGFLDGMSLEQRDPEFISENDDDTIENKLIGADSTTWSSVQSVLTSYIIPRETWLKYASKDRRRMWVTPRVPPTVSLDAFDSIDPTRFAYVREWNWEKSGVRGLFAISHWARGRFNYNQVIGKPVSSSLYTYLNKTMGMSETNFLMVAENVYWMSAVIGGFNSKTNSFYVHYNDDGIKYTVLSLPYDILMEYVRKLVPSNVQLMSWPSSTTPTSVMGINIPFAGRDLPPRPLPGEPQPIFGDYGSPTTIETEPPINEGFFGVDMSRFWPQFLVSLEIALFSPVRSVDLFNTLTQLPHWSALQYYFAMNRGKIAWLPPLYVPTLRIKSLGKYTKPDYMKK